MSKFGDLINIDEYGEKRDQFNEERGGVSYYCKDCKKIVDVKKGKKEFDFTCKECEGQEVVIGTLEGLKYNYKIK